MELCDLWTLEYSRYSVLSVTIWQRVDNGNSSLKCQRHCDEWRRTVGEGYGTAEVI